MILSRSWAAAFEVTTADIAASAAMATITGLKRLPIVTVKTAVMNGTFMGSLLDRFCRPPFGGQVGKYAGAIAMLDMFDHRRK